MTWPDTRLLDLFGIELPIVQAPMANASGVDMAVAVTEAGGLGSFPCAGLTNDKIREGLAAIRSRTGRPINLNFFCHDEPEQNFAREAAWLERLAPYYAELKIGIPQPPLKATIYRFTAETCALVEELCPEIVSFHFGLPDDALLARVKRAGCKVISTATSLREGQYLAARGVDAIIAQGAEAGGHRGMFLETDVATQIGTFALVQQIASAISQPIIAAGGIGDGRGIAACFALGACAVQIGTAYLCCPEATTSPLHRAALSRPGRETVLADVFSGRPARAVLCRFAREQGPFDPAKPDYPLATPALAPLRKAAEARGSGDFSWFWSGQGAPPPAGIGAGDLTRRLAEQAKATLAALT
jgi:nitronate monooxygenase